MVTAHGSQGELVEHGDTQAFEDWIADAGNRLSAEIVKAAFVALDTKEPFVTAWRGNGSCRSVRSTISGPATGSGPIRRCFPRTAAQD